METPIGASKYPQIKEQAALRGPHRRGGVKTTRQLQVVGSKPENDDDTEVLSPGSEKVLTPVSGVTRPDGPEKSRCSGPKEP